METSKLTESPATGRMLELVQIALGKREMFSNPPASLKEWSDMLGQVAEHSLVGITFPAVEKLSEKIEVPPEASYPWSKALEKIRSRNSRQRTDITRLHALFREAGFRDCLLKGQVSASFYPDPTFRQSGDIDIWLEGSREAIMDYLRSHHDVEGTRYIHCEVRILGKKPVEVHFTPSWMFSPLANRKLQRWFAAQAPEQFSHFDDALGICVPTLRFNGVYMLLHIFRHVFEEGIGLRQLMDYHFILSHLDDADRAAVVDDLRRLSLLRFAGAVMYVLQAVFRTDDSTLLCKSDPQRGKILLGLILQSGNFGHADPVFANGKSKSEGILAHGWRKIKRNLRYLALCPSEVLWMPWFVTWQYFWRKKHGYLYKGR